MQIDEIFLSLQGETEFVGIPFLFVRFSGCNLRCSYCDTPAAFTISPTCHIHFHGQESFLSNPLSIEQLTTLLSPYQGYWLSFTGGEPLLQREALETCLTHLKGFRFWMETNGTLPEALSPIIFSHIDVWSMDLKLPSAIGKNLWETQERFFSRIAETGKTIILKVILTPTTTLEEMEEVWKHFLLWREKTRSLSLTFQPMTSEKKVIQSESLRWAYEKTLSWPDGKVHLIPQIHPILQIP
ncbi:7-carboxy-7-deazaguanine synthase QueE [Thermospira aquatica]|uniref:7-carboxy-7-deazaguanine synthase n=1 Tax=Thermospira aquatica TaxID=2828656 RepID=A0AAX3BCD3_9SPIR|nr:7-carboxy-7-deazaguanine synthase QueE [Thermospira aquatica]URA09920.1 7-carboxy-7-deazaguanine synthase QueE [Thermospira aquatica]